MIHYFGSDSGKDLERSFAGHEKRALGIGLGRVFDIDAAVFRV